MKIRLQTCNGSFTIIELVIAVILGSVLVLAVATINVSTQRYFKSARLQGLIQGETMFISEQLVRDIKRSNNAIITTVSGSGLTDDKLTLTINPSNGDASDPSDDLTVIYQSGTRTTDIDSEMLYEFERTEAGSTIIIGSNLTFLQFYINPDNNFVSETITIKARTPAAVEMEYITFTSGATLRERRAGP